MLGILTTGIWRPIAASAVLAMFSATAAPGEETNSSPPTLTPPLGVDTTTVIDLLVDAEWQRRDARPSPRCDDATFVRRVYLDLAGRPNLERAEEIGRAIMDRFLSGAVNSVELIYSKFISAMVYRPTVQQWLPVQIEKDTGSPGHRVTGSPEEYIFEPSVQRVFEDLLPRWTLAKFQLLMLEAFTSEHSARMIAMKNATDNAEQIVTELTMQRNKIRQAAITKEISEIVGTAEALK